MNRSLCLDINNKPISLPDWITFAFGLGAFLHDEGIKYKKRANIVVTVPSDHYFSLFVAIGIADQIFSVKKQMRSIRNQVIALEPGNRIIYRDTSSSRKVSVLSVEPSPYNSCELLLNINDNGCKTGIPERSWLEKVIVLDEKYDDIKRTRKVRPSQQLGIKSLLLQELYTNERLVKAAFYPGDYFYIVGNKLSLEQQLSAVKFSYKERTGSIEDFLYIENLSNKSSYVNGRYFSSQLKKMDYEISDSIPVIYSDATSYRKQYKNFCSNPSLIIISRTDQEHRIHEITAELSRKFIQQEVRFITSDVISYLNEYPAVIPNGIEFFAWRE